MFQIFGITPGPGIPDVCKEASAYLCLNIQGGFKRLRRKKGIALNSSFLKARRHLCHKAMRRPTPESLPSQQMCVSPCSLKFPPPTSTVAQRRETFRRTRHYTKCSIFLPFVTVDSESVIICVMDARCES